MSGQKINIPQLNTKVFYHGIYRLINNNGNTVILADKGMNNTIVKVRYVHQVIIFKIWCKSVTM